MQPGKRVLGATEVAFQAGMIRASTFGFLPQFLPEDALIRDWVARCQARPSTAKAKAFDQALLTQAAVAA